MWKLLRPSRQRFGATGALAAGQTTMNNLTFGNAKHQYYETICGGAGAGAGFNGASAVHTHMTNTRLTDPEILEWRHPVLSKTLALGNIPAAKGHTQAVTALSATSGF